MSKNTKSIISVVIEHLDGSHFHPLAVGTYIVLTLH